MRILGIDSGLSGAAAVLDAPGSDLWWPQQARLIDCRNLPLLDGRIDVITLRNFISSHGPDEVVAEGVTRGGKLCRSAGMVEATVRLLGIVYLEVSPQRWRRGVGLEGKGKRELKGNALKMVQRIFPEDAAFFARAKDHDRCEAVLIATWGMLRKHRLRGDLAGANQELAPI